MQETTPTTAPTTTLAVESTPSGTNYPFAGVTLTAGQLDSVIATIAQVRELLPAMHDLTPIDRQRISKLGMRTRGFADAALEAAKADPGLLPQSIALESFVSQDALLRDLSLVQTHVSDLKSLLDDALLLIGNHVYSVSRTVYAMMKTDGGKARLQEQKALMKQRFAFKKNSQPADKTTVRE
jgi:hypothetical protein